MSSFQYNQTIHSLKELHQTLLSSASLTLTTPLSIIQNLINNLPVSSSSHNATNHFLNLSLYIDHQYSILQFLTILYKSASILGEKVWVDARLASFTLLTHLLKSFEHSGNKRFVPSKDTEPNTSLYLKVIDLCIFSFRRDPSNTVKKAILPPLIISLQHFRNNTLLLTNSNYPVRRIYEIFHKELMKGKSGIGVKSELLTFLCHTMEVFPEQLHAESKRLFKTCMDSLREQSISHDPKPMIISQTFLALKYLLYPFADAMEEGQCKTLYLYISKAMEQVNATRHDMSKSALKLLTAHPFLLKTYIYRDAVNLYDRLEQLCDHRNAEVRKMAFPALEAVLGVLSQSLTETANSSEPAAEHTFEIMICKFKALLAPNRRHTKYSMGTAICSIGAFAQPMHKFLGEQETKNILYKLFEFGDQVLSRGEEDANENLYHLPSFISAFANILLTLDDLETWIFEFLEKFLVVLFANFPKQYLYPKLRYKTYMSFIRLIVSLSFKQEALNRVLSRSVVQCLTLAIVPRKDAVPDEEPEIKQYEQYLDLWVETLNPVHYQTKTWVFPWSSMSISKEDLDKIHCIIYDQIMQTIIQMMTKLDLRVELTSSTVDDALERAESGDIQTDDSFVPSDIASHISPSNSKDFELFLNLVEFHILLMRLPHKRFMCRWVDSLSKFITEKSLSLPYVSGFFKIMAQIMKVSSQLNYFENVNEDTKISATNKYQSAESLYFVDVACKVSSFHDIRYYCKQTMNRLHEFKGDLLSSVIQFLLSVPLNFMNSEEFVTPLMLAFQQGISYLPLAKVGLSTLESWISSLGPEKLNSCLSKILPCLNQYLSLKDQSNTEERKFRLQQKKRSITVQDNSEEEKHKKMQKNMFDEADLTPLRDVQLRIIRLLARLGGENYFILNEDPEKLAERIMSWDSQSKILFNIPFRDIKPEMYLDSLLPRVAELAESSGDRQTKVAACEFLHSLMLFMIGTNAINPNSRAASTDEEAKPTQFFKIYSHLFPVLIRLAVDNDQVTRQLFEPFIYQIIHWLTQNMQYEHKETMALLDCIVEGLCHPYDGAVRDLCASLLNEFLRWSVKHDRSKNYHNVKSLFQRLYSHACHPNLHKRLGATVAFNRMYRSFREVPELVDYHVLDWFHMTIKSLKMSHSLTDEDKFLVEQNVNLLQHLEKIVTHKANILLEKQHYRGCHPDLYDLVRWLFSQCSCQETHARRECMRLFVVICMCLPEYQSEAGPAQWIQDNILVNDCTDILVSMAEYDHIDPLITLRSPNQSNKITFLVEWLSHVSTSLDTYHWLFTQRLVAPKDIFKNERSTLVRDVILFLQKICVNSVNKLLSVTIAEEKLYNAMRTQVITNLFRLCIVLFSKFEDSTAVFESILNRFLFLPLLLATTHPSSLGFDSMQEDKRFDLFSLVDKFYKVLGQTSDPKKYLSLISAIYRQISTKPGWNVLLFDVSSSQLRIDEATIWFRGLRLLHRRGILQPALSLSQAEFSSQLLRSIEAAHRFMNPTQTSIAQELMELAFEVGDPNEMLITLLSNEEQVAKSSLFVGSMTVDESAATSSAKNLESTKGKSFYIKFTREMIKHMSNHLDFFVKRLMSLAANPFFFSILIDMAIHFMKNSKNRAVFIQLVMDNNHLLTDHFFESSLDFRLNVVHLFEKIRFVSDNIFNYGQQVTSSQSGAQERALPAARISQIYLKSIQTAATQDSSFPVALKYECMQAIPDLINSTFSSSALIACKSIVDNEFPVTPEELSEESDEYDKHVKLLDSLLHSMQISANIGLFRTLLQVFRWVNHPLRRRMNRSLEGMFEKLNNEKLLLIANECFTLFLNEELPQSYRSALIQWVTITTLSKMGEDTLKEYFKQHIKTVVDSVEKEISSELLNNPRELVSVTCAYNLLETLFRLLPAGSIKKEINTEYCRQAGMNASNLKGNELTSKVMRAAYTTRRYKAEGASFSANTLLELRQSSYNALAGAVMCTQTKEKHFTAFLFRSQNSDLWDHIVDKEKQMHFEIETNFDIYTQAINKLRIEAPGQGSSHKAPTRYLSSQYLTDSSLNGDLPYLSSFYIPGSSYAKTDHTDEDGDILMADADDIINEQQEKITSVENDANSLEMDHINQNPCMPSILRVIDFMYKKFSPTNAADQSAAMPEWMKLIYTALNDSSTHINIKFFLTKIIVNRPHIFEPYCHSFFEPLVAVATTPLESNKGIHYFVRDICILLLRWDKLDPGESLNGRAVATSLVEFLMKHSASKKRVILRHNLELLKLIVEKWKPFIRVEKKIILGWICFDQSHSSAALARTTGLQIIGVMIANDISAYDKQNDTRVVSEQKYYECIVNNLTQSSKKVYEAGAEICGMILKFLSSQMTDSNSYELFDQIVAGQCMLFLSENKYDRFLNILSKIAVHHVPFIDHFLPTKLLDILPKLFGLYKKIALQLVSRRAEHFSDIHVHFQPHIKSNLERKEEPIQLLTLQIIHKFARKISEQYFQQFLQIIEKVGNSLESAFSEPCRMKYFEILIWVFDNRTEFQDKDCIRQALLQGLNDSSDYIRKLMLEFWDHESRLSAESVPRLEQLFKWLYSPALGGKWLQHAVHLMLQLTHRSPDFENTKALFAESLAKCEFKNYDIDTSFRSLPSTLMMTQSMHGGSNQSNQSRGNPNNEDAQKHAPPGQVLATQSNAFSMTLNYSNEVQSLLSDQSSATSSLLFVPFKNTISISASRDAGNNNTNESQMFDRSKVRRRFTRLKDTTMTQTHIRRALRIKNKRDVWTARQKLKRHTKLNLYRTYRTGELPDIQIALKELVIPLQALCLSDVQTAKTTFVAISNAMFSNIRGTSSKFNQKSVHKLLKNIASNIVNMVEESKDDSVLINALWNVCLQHPPLQMGLSESPLVNASMGSFNVELGILVYENMINRSMENILNMMRKKSKTEEDREAIEEQKLAQYEAYVRLARLYGELGEDDIVRAIFEHHCSHHDITKKALEYERNHSYKDALKQYTVAIQETRSELDEIDEEVTFWEFQSLSCMKKLTSWDELSDRVTAHICGDPPVRALDQVWEMEHRDYYLPLVLESYIKTPERWTDLREFIEESNETPSKKQLLDLNFPHRLATMDLINGDAVTAKVHIMDGFAQFVHNWSSLSSLSRRNRHKQLQILQPQIESEEYISMQHADDKSRVLVRQIEQWNSRFPSTVLDDETVWDDVIMTRLMLFNNLEKMVKTSNLENMAKTELVKHVLSAKAKLLLKGSKAVQYQNNLLLSQKYLKEFQGVWKQLHKSEEAIYGCKEPFNFTFFESLVHLFLLKGEKQSDVNSSMASLSKVIAYMKNNHAELNQSHPFDDVDATTKQVQFNSMFATAHFAAATKMHEAGETSSVIGSMDKMTETAHDFYNKACVDAKKQPQKFVHVFQQMANFCDHILQNGIHTVTPTNTLAKCAVKNYMLSMQHSAQGMRASVPQVLKYIEMYPDTRAVFTGRWRNVPHWMFLSWISQMIPHLNGAQGEYIIDIIDQLASEYPQGVYFPWSISEPDLDPKNERVRQGINAIGRKVHNSQTDRFVHELNRLTNPGHRWNTWRKKLHELIKKGDNLTELKKSWEDCFDDLFDPQREHLGSFNKKFAEIWSPVIKRDLGDRSGSKLLSMSNKRFVRAIHSISGHMRKSKNQDPVGKARLSHFSPYLTDYQASKDLTKCIALPGQYEIIDRDPNQQSLVMISSFDPILLVLSSIRRPKRLTIHGNDEKDHNFLVKGGEDLRQDQRIEQMFMMMNDILSRDPHTRKRELHLNTYKVVPMTKDVGVLEWVDNTTPIKGLVESEIARVKNTSNVHLLRLEPATVFDKMLNKTEGKDHARYLKSYQVLSRKMVTQCLLQEYSLIRKDHFKNALQSLASSQEAFFMIRNRFGKSLSVFNMCSYLLGIGDRHLDNFLLDCTNGEVVGIDFGHAFGSATELPVPELLPFRLTRQFIEVFTPLTTSHEIAIQRNGSVATGGIFLENMTHTLVALRHERDKLTACMEIFVREPLVDWLKNARPIQNQRGTDEATSTTTSTAGTDVSSTARGEEEEIGNMWYPDRKLTLAKRKLDLWNPVHILEHDLAENVHVKKAKCLDHIVKVARGESKYNARARFFNVHGERCTSEREQVECLIDLATDPAVLQRVYMGWAPYV